MVRIASLAVVVLLAGAGVAWADGEDAPVATSTGPGWVDQEAKDARPATMKPAPVGGPMADLSALHGVRDESFFGNLHGSVGVMIGSNNTRGAYANVHGPIGDNADFALSFSTIHSDGMPYYGYGGGYGYYPPPGYGRFQGTSYSLGGAYTFKPNRYNSPFYFDPAAAGAWPGYAPYGNISGEVTTDVTGDPAG